MVRAWLVWFVALNLAWLALIANLILAEEVLGCSHPPWRRPAAVAVARQRLFRFRPRWEWILRLEAALADPRGDGLGARVRWRVSSPGARRGGVASAASRSAPAGRRERVGHQAALLTAGRSFPEHPRARDRRRSRADDRARADQPGAARAVTSYYLIAAAVLLAQIGPLIVFSVRHRPRTDWSPSMSGGDITTLALVLLAAGTGASRSSTWRSSPWCSASREASLTPLPGAVA